jgi:CubicO group peptidase (beta-lactamase class C family)
LSAIVADASGQSTLAFARTKLFDPLGIDSKDAAEPVFPTPAPADLRAYQQASVGWPTDPGLPARLRLAEAAQPRPGQARVSVPQWGRWEGKQIIPEAYVRAATRAHTRMVPAEADDYGYLWRVGTVGGHHSFRAWGAGGQVIQVVPDLDLVGVITSDWAQPREDAPSLVPLVIIPAVNDA